MAHVLIFEVDFLIKFWGVYSYGILLINYTPFPLILSKTLYKVLFGKVLIMIALKVFCCLNYIHWKPRNRDKFRERAYKCIFIGYPFGEKA